MVTVLRVLCALVGGLAILGAVHPGSRVSTGRFSRSPGPPLGRAARIALFVLGLVCLGVAATCGRP